MTEYFANLEDQELAAELMKRVDDYYSWILTSGRLARWRVAYNTYYGQRGTHNSSYVSEGGEKGELSFLMSNEFRNLVQHLLVMSMQAKPSLEFVSTNTDSKSKAQTFLARGIVNYYRRDGKIDFNTFLATEIALIMDTGWVFNEWDNSLNGDIRPDPETGVMLKKGDIYSRARTPLDVIIDYQKQDGSQNNWKIVKDTKNKFDLAAQYPEKADEILSIKRDSTKDALYRFGDSQTWADVGVESNEIDVYTFYHEKTPACQEGKVFQFLSNKSYLGPSAPLPYRKTPGNRVCPTEQILSPLGYSNANDLLALQDVIDALISSAVTNMTASGANLIWSKPGGDFDYEQLADGMSLIECEEKPEVLMLNRLPPEWFSLANFVIGRMEAISGVNSVARGNSEGGKLSGAAMALLQSMSIQFNSGLQKAINKLIEDNGNDIIQLTQDFANEPRLGMIVGIRNKNLMKEYSSKDLSDVQRVYCRQGNPMRDTAAGQWEIIKEAIQMGGIKSVGKLMEVLDTGSFDAVVEDERTDRLTIDQENDAITMGEPVIVSFTDIHPDHLIGHRKPLTDPESRKDPELLKRVKDHVDEHMAVWQGTDPLILQAFGIPPFPGTVPQMMPGGQPNGEPQPKPNDGGLPVNAPGQMEEVSNIATGQPSMPKNPLTGDEFSPDQAN